MQGKLASHASLPELAAGLKERMTAPTAITAVEHRPLDSAAQGLTFTLADGFGPYAPGQSFHDVAYDAYETGRIFAYYRAALGASELQLGINAFANRVCMTWSLFELSLGHTEDALTVDGIARHVYEVDTASVNIRTVPKLFRQLGGPEDTPEWTLRWTGPKSFILVVHGLPDMAKGAPGRKECERCLDLLLAAQKVQGRLKVERIEDLVAKAAAVLLIATSDGASEAKCARRK